jgi:hypothetical protein
MRLFFILSILFTGIAFGQVLDNPNKLKPCPSDKNTPYHNCWGTYTYSSGNKYVGEYRNNERNGQGTAIFIDGNKYVGEFKDGKFHGRGMYNFHTGSKYVGEFKDDKFHGQGIYTWPDGRKELGEYKNDELDGRGIRFKKDGVIYESGIYKNGKLVKSLVIEPSSFSHIAK